ncbi:MAG: pilus type biosis protein MshL [Gammaproteobacteria bacterium]|jgi:MSHA biogenesis protein MshL|nr:pilus type biosis protein MshL [Gammaproteobacteria bacterium]
MKQQWIAQVLLFSVSAGFLLSCAPTKIPTAQRPATTIQSTLDSAITSNKAVEEALKPPSDVATALMPSLSVKAPGAKTANAERFDVSVNNVSAKDFFMGLVDGTPYNIIVEPDLAGSISLNLKNVTIAEVMEAVRESYGYEYEQTKLGYRVFSARLRTQIFTINYLNVLRNGASQTQVSSGISSDINNTDGGTSTGTTAAAASIPGAADGGTTSTPTAGAGGSGTSNTTVSTQTTSDFWGTLRTSLVAIIGKEGGRSVVLNPQAGVVVVHAEPSELREVAAYLDKIQNSMNRQVLIEAKVLEVTLRDGFQQGINWELFGVQQQGNRDLKESGFRAFGLDATGAEDSNDFNIFSAHASAGDNFDATIKLLSVQGDIQVLSSPRIATVNNQKALIKVGEDQFFVTNVSSSTTGTGSASPTTSQDVELTPFFSGIALDITPQIDINGDVTLHVHPTVVTVTDQNKTIELSASEILKLPLALSEVRETDSIVHAKNGQVVAIGGLMTNFYADRRAMTPGFGELPVAGNLFRDSERRWQKRELVILLRPVVITEKSASEQLVASQKAFEEIEARGKQMEKPVSIAHWFDKVP